MSDLEIYGFDASTYVRTARAVCVEKGVPYRLVPINYGEPDHFAVHPFGKMPALRHGSVHLFETAAIAAYVDAAFDGPALQPTSPAELGLMWQWVSAANSYMYDACVQAMLNEAGEPEGNTAQVRRILDALARDAERGAYLAGETLSIADLFVAPMLGFYVSQVEGGSNRLADWPSVTAWLNRVEGRKSLRETTPA